MNSFTSLLFKRVSLALIAVFIMVGLNACGERDEQSATDDTASSSGGQVAPQLETRELIARAQEGLAEATRLSHAWSVTQPLIDQAQAALQAGEEDRARELAQRALTTALASVEQAQLEAQSWQSRVPQ